MSRVAKNPVKLPAGVEVKLTGQQLSVKGAKGTLELNVHSSVEVLQEAQLLGLHVGGRNGECVGCGHGQRLGRVRLRGGLSGGRVVHGQTTRKPPKGQGRARGGRAGARG